MERDIKTRLQELIIECSGRDDLQLEDLTGKRLIEDLNYDSVALITLISAIEEEFGIKFDDMEEFVDVINEFDQLLNTL